VIQRLAYHQCATDKVRGLHRQRTERAKRANLVRHLAKFSKLHKMLAVDQHQLAASCSRKVWFKEGHFHPWVEVELVPVVCRLRPIKELEGGKTCGLRRSHTYDPEAIHPDCRGLR